ncbi:SGNH hydrolase domain-containing protein, partial [Rhizobiaceae sp. 2RAB30]
MSAADLLDRDCVINGSSAEEEPKILLWGDSNAAHYVALLGEIAKRQGFSFRNVEHSACAPLLKDGYTFSPRDYRLSCRASHKVILPALDKYDTLIITAQWTHYDG